MTGDSTARPSAPSPAMSTPIAALSASMADSDTNEIWLEKHDDMIEWDGCFYGDMEVFIAGDNHRA